MDSRSPASQLASCCVATLFTVAHSAHSGAAALTPQLALIRSLPASRRCRRDVDAALLTLQRRFSADDGIVTQGEVGEAFFVIAEGTVAVTVDDVPRRELAAGDSFGEIALLHDVPRTATVTAVDAVDTFVVDREQFLDSIGAHARSTVVAEAVASARMAADVRAPA